MYFHVYTEHQDYTGEFQRIVFKYTGYPDLVVVHYKGNADVAGVMVQKAHRAKFPAISSDASLLSPTYKKIRLFSSIGQYAGNKRPNSDHVIPVSALELTNGFAKCEADTVSVLKEIRSSEDHETISPTSRESQTSQNISQTQRPRLQNSSISRLLDITEKVSCIDTLMLCPQHLVIGYHDDHIADFQKILDVLPATQTQALHYDSCYQLGNFTVSPLFYRNTLLKSAPKMPLMYVVYDGSDTDARKQLLRSLKKRIPKIAQVKDVCIVLDNDKELVDEISALLPNLSLLRSPVDLLQVVEDWFRFHNDSTHSENACIRTVTNLIQCTSDAEYQEQLCLSKLHWSREFKLFFENNIESNQLKCQIWKIDRRDGVDMYNYLQSRCAHFEQMVQSFEKWTNVEMEYIIIAMHFLCCHFANDAIWSKMGLGSYTLLQKFRPAFELSSIGSTNNIYSVPNPSDILSFLQENSFDRIFEMMAIKRENDRLC